LIDVARIDAKQKVTLAKIQEEENEKETMHQQSLVGTYANSKREAVTKNTTCTGGSKEEHGNGGNNNGRVERGND